jgi:hypothetical protein
MHKSHPLPFLLSVLLAMTLFSPLSCKTRDESDSSVKNDEQLVDKVIPMRGPKQVKSLGFVFYRGNPTPVMPLDSEIDAFKDKFLKLDATSLERRLLRKVYHDRYDLMTIASRDSDGDGIRDFRVSQYFGKFSEGDLDLDGDGIRNILDVDPFDPSVGGKDRDGDGHPDADYLDANKNTVPDHVDFALIYPETKHPFSKRLSEIQVELYKSHKIILVERNQEFTIEAAEVIYDSVKRIFASTFGKRKVLPTLRTIATEEQALLIPEEGAETNALVNIPLQTMIIYRSGLEVPPIVLLGLLTHELGHSIQFDMDYSTSDHVVENNRIYFPNPKFFTKMSEYKWSADDTPIRNLPNFSLWTPVYEYIRPNFTWQNQTPTYWTKYIDEIWKKEGDDYMYEKSLVDNHVVSQYSTMDPFEWLSDNQIAYIFTQIEKEVLSGLGQDERKKKAFQKNLLATIEGAWQGFAHSNQSGSKIIKYLETTMPIEKSDLKILAERYGKPIIDKPQIVQGNSLLLTGSESGRRGFRCRPAFLAY